MLLFVPWANRAAFRSAMPSRTRWAKLLVLFALRKNLSLSRVEAVGRADGSFCKHRATNACREVQVIQVSG